MPHLEVHKCGFHPTAVSCGLIPRHSKCQNISLVGLCSVHQGSILDSSSSRSWSCLSCPRTVMSLVMASHQTMVPLCPARMSSLQYDTLTKYSRPWWCPSCLWLCGPDHSARPGRGSSPPACPVPCCSPAPPPWCWTSIQTPPQSPQLSCSPPLSLARHQAEAGPLEKTFLKQPLQVHHLPVQTTAVQPVPSPGQGLHAHTLSVGLGMADPLQHQGVLGDPHLHCRVRPGHCQ